MSAGAELAALLTPLVDAASSPEAADRLLRDLGLVTTPGVPAPVPAELTAVADAARAAIDAVLALDDPDVGAVDRVAGLAAALNGVLDAVAGLTRLAEDPGAVASMPPPFDIPQLWSLLGERVPAWLLVRWLRVRHRPAFDVLTLLGVTGGATTFNLDRLAAAAGDPAAALASALAEDPGVLLAPLRRLLGRSGTTAASNDVVVEGQSVLPNDEREPVRPGRLDIATRGQAGAGAPGLAAAAEESATADGPGLAVTVSGLDLIGAGLDAGGGWSLSVAGGPGVAGAVLGAGWASPLPAVVPEDGDATVPTLDEVSVTLIGQPQTPWALVGSRDATRIELDSVTLGVTGTALTSQPAVEVTVTTDGLRIVLVPDDADAFLATLLGGEVSAAVMLAAAWSPDGGLTVDGAAGLRVVVPTTVSLGPLTLSGITIELAVTDGGIALAVTTEIGGAAGPVRASVSGLGVRAELLPGEQRGPGIVSLGPVGLAVGFQPPSGASLGIDLGAVGGGWVGFDTATGRYSGVVDLTVLGVGICAVVLIDTGGAVGPGGWSMFLALFLNVPTLQLGFGFTLTGVGGLFGVDRVLDTEALASAVRSGALDAVLFPADPVGDAPDVVAELSSLFPPSTGRSVIGPVVRIGWGTPTLIEAELGVVLTLPDPVVVTVIGTVSSVLPTQDVNLVELHFDVAGVVEMGAGTLAIDAGLHDSHVVGFALTGDLALRASFLDAPTFLMALGGFHPAFDAPAGFPTLRRLSLAIGAAPVIDISFDCYLALTSNSVQFGAKFHLSAEVEGFGVEGGTSFDALVEFSPFRVATRLTWYVSVIATGLDLLAVRLEASVEGPNPWLVVGTARFEVLGVTEHLRIDEQIGGHVTEPVLPAADLLGDLVSALEAAGAWSVASGASAGVVLGGGDGGSDGVLVVPPDGILAVSQRAVPLGLRLDTVGDESVGPYDTFVVEPADGSLASSGTVLDWFPPGYFLTLDPSEQLSSPSFERLESGIDFGGGEPVAGPARTATLDYEQIVRDPAAGQDRTAAGTVALDEDGRPELVAVLAGSAGPAVAAVVVADDPDAVRLAPVAYAVTDRDSGRLRVRAGTWSAAHQSGPGAQPSTTLVPSWEAPS